MNRLPPSHFALVEAKCVDTRFDILAITETFLHSNMDDSHLSLDGFNFYRADREGMDGGGVGVYVRDDFTVEVLAAYEPLSENKSEYIILQIVTTHTKILFAAIYRRPPADYPLEFLSRLSIYLPHYSSVIITGDFNINMATPTAPNSSKLQAFIDRHSLYLIPSEPTHHQLWNHSHTWIDLFITKNPYPVTNYHKSPAPFIARHDFIELTLPCRNPPPLTKSIPSRNLKKLDHGLLRHELSSLLTNVTPPTHSHRPLNFITCSASAGVVMSPCSTDVSEAERQLTKALITAFNTCAPLRSIVLSSRRKPRVSVELRVLMRTCDRAYRIARTSGSVVDLHHFRTTRAIASNALDTAKNNYISLRLEDAIGPEDKWRELRRLRVSGSTNPSPFRYFDAETLNLHFSATVNRHPPMTELDYDSIAEQSSHPIPEHQFCLRPVTKTEVHQAINRSASKASGPDGISASMLKLAMPTALANFTALINSSIINATVPTEWKKALIRPLAKSKILRLPSDTRPIALPSECSKVLERLVHDQLSGYLETHALFSPHQAGFRRGHRPRQLS